MELRKEFLEFIRDRLVLRTTISISIPTLVSILSIISGRSDILWISVYTIIIVFIGSNSAYILLAQKEVDTVPVHEGDSTKKLVARYERLRPYGWRGVILSVLLVPLFALVHPFDRPVDILIHGTPTPIPTLTPTQTQTPIPTQTFTTTPSPTNSVTPSATATISPSRSIYYMIVVDASAEMNEAFDGSTKWDAALESIDVIFEGLDSEANYGLVVIGGSTASEGVDPCDEPSVVNKPFTSQNIVSREIGQFQPSGGGSLYTAFNLAKNQFKGLPPDTIRSLIYITGSSDACERRDEWKDLEKLFQLPGAVDVNLYSEIIILDENTGLVTQTIAQRISSLSKNINAQAPQSIQEIHETTNITVINNVTNYINNEIEAMSTEASENDTAAFTHTPKSSSSTPIQQVTVVLPPPPAFTAIPPTPVPSTPIPPPTDIPASGPSSTPTPGFFTCPSTRPTLHGSASYAGTITINSPANCSTGHPPEFPIDTNGTSSGISGTKKIWVLVYPPNNLYYPQSPDACATPAPPPTQSAGTWSVNTFLGTKGEGPKSFDIVVVLVDQTASDFLSGWVHNGCVSGKFDGIPTNILEQYNITEKDFITVQTR